MPSNPIPNPITAATQAREHAARGDSLYSQGQVQAAFDQFADAVRLQPAVADYHFRLASAAWKLNRPAEVEKHYLEAVRLDSNFAEAHQRLAQWYVQRLQTKAALTHSARALALEPADVDVRITHAVMLIADEQPQPAWEMLEPIIKSGFVNWHLASAYADLAHRIGHHEQAVALIERALAESNPAPTAARRLHVSAASLLEASGKYDQAFAHMRSAKQLVPDKFDPQAYAQWASHGMAYFTKRKLQSLPHADHGNARPVFIVGMPRSGTSLLEQILASHPAVHGAGELRLIGETVESLAKMDFAKGPAAGGYAITGYPDCLDLCSLKELNRIAAHYVDGIAKLSPQATYVTDKMPQNFEYLGLIELLLPQCRIIHCQRDPRDTCLSCFLTDFDRGHAFTRDLRHLASYYRDYQRLMAHWKTVLSVPILDVAYEQVIADPEPQIRRMLDFLHLPWDDRCLRFHESKRTVTTASRDQVRRPIYASSVGRWQRYAGSIPELLELAP